MPTGKGARILFVLCLLQECAVLTVLSCVRFFDVREHTAAPRAKLVVTCLQIWSTPCHQLRYFR